MPDIRPAINVNGKRCLIEALPRVFRLIDYAPIRVHDRLTCCTATLYHRYLTFKVVWSVRTPDPKLRPTQLVSIRWNGTPDNEDGAVVIDRLISVSHSDEHTNLFDTIPPSWPVDRALVERGCTLISALPRRFRHLFNAILWDGQRFLRYVTGPASLDRTHNQLNGNLRHSLDVADYALSWAADQPQVFRPLLILGSLLHDAGKADCYTLDRVHPRFSADKPACRIGHRAILLDWVSEACEALPVSLPRPHERALLEMLTTVGSSSYGSRYAPDDLTSLETRLVDRADRCSMQFTVVHTSNTTHAVNKPHLSQGATCRT